jgi:hypothetical protein
METQQIINWLRDKACRADNPSWTRMMNKAADRLKELDQTQNQKTGRWIIHSSGKGDYANNWAECSECHVCGSPQWKVCPVCETRMVKENER